MTLSKKTNNKKHSIRRKSVKRRSDKRRRRNSTKKTCPPNKVLNPKSGRCVSKTGRIGRKLSESQNNKPVRRRSSSRRSSIQRRRSSRRRSRSRSSVNKTCPPNKVLNPKSGRCVSKTGIIGKKLLVLQAQERAKKSHKILRKSTKAVKRKLKSKKMTYYNAILYYMEYGTQYCFDDIKNKIKNNVSQGDPNYVFDINNKTSDIIKALKKAITNNKIYMIKVAGNKNLYKGNIFIKR